MDDSGRHYGFNKNELAVTVNTGTVDEQHHRNSIIS